MRPLHVVLRLGTVKAESGHLVLAWSAWKSLALLADPQRGRREPADANVGRRTDTLMCADATKACGL